MTTAQSRLTASIKARSTAIRNRQKPFKAFQIKHTNDDRNCVFDQLIGSIASRNMAKQAETNNTIKSMVDNRYKIIHYSKYRNLKE